MSLEICGTSVIGATLAGHVSVVGVFGNGDEPHQSAVATSKSLTEPTDSESAAIRDTRVTPPADPANPTSFPPTPLPPHLVSESPGVAPTAQRRSRPASRNASPYPRSGPSTPNRNSTLKSSAPSASRQVPPRRSARTLAKGPDRPPGPPELEAALAIAIRNLDSDIYEWWCANHKTGSPVPTAAYLKARSPRIRRAAEAVDEADRLVNEAVYGRPNKGRSTAKGSPLPPKAPPRELPEAPFERLERNSQGSSPLRPMAKAISAQSGRSDLKARRSPRNKGSAGDS